MEIVPGTRPVQTQAKRSVQKDGKKNESEKMTTKNEEDLAKRWRQENETTEASDFGAFLCVSVPLWLEMLTSC
jgi:hypothetical protein